MVDPIPDPDSGPAVERITAPLFASYRDSAHEAFHAPPATAFAVRARRRGRRRVMLAAAAVVVTAVGGVAFAATRVDRGQPDVTDPSPAPSSSVTPSPSTPPSPSESSPSSSPPSRSATAPAAIDLSKVDWGNTTVVLPATRDDNDCPVGRITTRGGSWPEAGGHGRGSIRGSYAEGAATLGELDGEPRTEAVVYITCLAAGGDSGDSSGQLLVVTQRGNDLVGLGYVGPLAQVYGPLRITDRRLAVTVTQKYSDTSQQRTYRWNGTRFVQVAGPSTFPSPPG